MIGSLGLGMLLAAICTFVAVAAFDAGILLGLLVYSLSGMLATLAIAWRRVVCEDRHAAL